MTLMLQHDIMDSCYTRRGMFANVRVGDVPAVFRVKKWQVSQPALHHLLLPVELMQPSGVTIGTSSVFSVSASMYSITG